MHQEELTQAIGEVARIYDVDHKTVESCINMALLKKRRTAFPTADYVEWERESGISVYSQTGKKQLDGVGRGIKRLILYEFENNLLKNKVIGQEYLRLKQYANEITSARIERVLENGDLFVVQVGKGVFGEEQEIARGLCKYRDQSPYERDQDLYRPGRTMWVYVKKVQIIQNQGVPAILPLYSRSTKKLPEMLLHKLNPEANVKCVGRIAGRRSDVVTDRRIEQSSIKTVNTELHERVHVKYIRNASHGDIDR